MFQAFWDESGTHAKDLLIMAGFVGAAEKWVTFTEQWQTILVHYGVSHVHMKDFNNYKSGVFKNLTAFHRTALYCELLKVIKETVSIGFVCSVHQAEFDAAVPAKFRSRDIGTPYTLLTQTAVEVVSDWAKSQGSHEPIAYMFEDGHRNASQAREHLHEVNKDLRLKEKYLLGPYAFERKEGFPPLQSADVLAWTSYGGEMDYKNKIVSMMATKRGPLHAFGIPTEWKHCQESYIKELVSRASQSKRRIRQTRP